MTASRGSHFPIPLWLGGSHTISQEPHTHMLDDDSFPELCRFHQMFSLCDYIPATEGGVRI